VFQIPGAQPGEHLGCQVRRLHERDPHVVGELIELAAVEAFTRRLRELLIQEVHPPEHRRAGTLRHQPGGTDRRVVVRRHRPRIEEAFEECLLVDVDRS
jgi:hypothetical protein